MVLPNRVAFSEGSFPVTVSAMYSYGKPVKGQVVVNFITKKEGYYFDFIDYNLFSRTLNISSPTTFNVDFARDLKFQSFSSSNLNEEVRVEATFMSEYTGEKVEWPSSNEVYLYTNILSFEEYYQKVSIAGSSTYERNSLYNFTIFTSTLDSEDVRLSLIHI